MSKYRAYPVYKDSGVEWLGEVPEHWDSVSLRWISKRYSGGTPDKSNDDYWNDGTIPWLNSGAVNQQVITEPSTYITEEAFKNSSAKWIPENSVLIALAGQGKTKGMAAYTTFPTTCNQSMAAIIFEKYNSKFMFWWLTSQYKNIRGLASDDGRDGLNLEMLGSIPCPIFDEKEQQQIAAFLDNKTAHLDTLIEKKQQMIGLLNEKRIALITQAVTKGLDLTVPMKDSGVEWLGNVPEHWEMKRLKFVFVLQRGHDLSTDKMKGGEYPVCASNGIIGWHDEYTSIAPSVTVGRSGSVGEVNYVEQKFWAHNTALYIKQFFDCMPRYSYYLLCVLDLKSLSFGSAVGSLNRNYIHDLKIVIPSVIEQEKIVNHIEHETQKIDDMIKTVKQAIFTLQEYRTALITAAVTGKIDVRTLTPHEG